AGTAFQLRDHPGDGVTTEQSHRLLPGEADVGRDRDRAVDRLLTLLPGKAEWSAPAQPQPIELRGAAPACLQVERDLARLGGAMGLAGQPLVEIERTLDLAG